MFYVRTPREQGEELIGNALSLLWMVVHSVQGIGLKDLKQILRKEQVMIFSHRRRSDSRIANVHQFSY